MNTLNEDDTFKKLARISKQEMISVLDSYPIGKMEEALQKLERLHWSNEEVWDAVFEVIRESVILR